MYVVLLLLILAVIAIENDLGNKYVEVTNDTYSTLDDDNVLFVLYKPWSSDFKRLIPTLNHIHELVQPKVKVGVVDIVNEKEIIKKFSFHGSVYIVLRKIGEIYIPYSGDFTLDGILDFLKYENFYTEIPSHVHLHAYNYRGNAEPIRLALSIHGVDFNETLYEYNPNITDFKIDNPFYISQIYTKLPIIEYSDFVLNNDQSILRYLARKFKLYGTNHNEHAYVDMYMDSALDVEAKYLNWAYEIDCLGNKDKYRNDISTFLGYWERDLSSGKKLHFVGEELTMADITIYNIIDINLRYFPDLLTNYRQLFKFVTRMDALPKLDAYKKSPKRLQLLNNERACIDGPHTVVDTERK